MNWQAVVARLSAEGTAHVVLTVIKVEGSSPRGVLTKMVVEESACHGTIGGGNLEYQAISTAREMLRIQDQPVQQITYTLGEELRQCCGGRVTLLYEFYPAVTPSIVVFGAGHVGAALVSILEQTRCQLTWFDSRMECQFDSLQCNTRPRLVKQPVVQVDTSDPDSLFVVLTHSHELDYEIVEAVLSRPETQYCGLISSKSKAASFRSRLLRKGFTDAEVSRLVAPIGIDVGGHDEPMAVAVSIAAQLLQKGSNPVAKASAASATKTVTDTYENF